MRRFFGHVFAFTVALVFVIFGWTFMQSHLEKQAYDDFNPSVFVESIDEVVYFQENNRDFIGKWFVKIYDAKTNVVQCGGNGEGNYLKENSGTKVRSLEWYVGKDCGLKPGRYYLITSYILEDNNGTQIEKKFRSNIFKVE